MKSIMLLLTNLFSGNSSYPYGKDTSSLMKDEHIPNKHMRGTITHKENILKAEKEHRLLHPELYSDTIKT